MNFSKKIYGIDVDLIDEINECARSVFPDEFLCALSAEDGVINEMILLPGTIYGDSHSIMNVWMAPVNVHLIGTAHSHPDYCNMASDADLDLFSNMGGYHIITCMPYDRTSWKIYNSKGEEVQLELIDCII